MGRTRPLYWLQVIGITLSLSAIAGCTGYKWRAESAVQYSAVEHGRVLRLIEVWVHAPDTSMELWHEQLVEVCTDGLDTASGLPCWPLKTRPVDQQLLRMIYDGMPVYRSKVELAFVANYLNHEIGTLRKTWIVGTHPLAMAFLAPQPTTGATTTFAAGSGMVLYRGRSGEFLADQRKRYSQLVGQNDLREKVNVLLIYPAELQLVKGYELSPSPRSTVMHAQLIVLRNPVDLEQLLHAVADPGKLEAITESTRTVRVTYPPD